MKSEEKLKILLKSAEKITREKDLNTLLLLISNVAKELLDVDRCSLFLSNEEEKILWTIVAHGVDLIKIPWDKGIAGYVFKTGRALIVNDAYKDSRFEKSVDKKTGYKTRNILAVPLISRKGECIGVFQAINKENRIPFLKEDEEMLTLISGFATSAVENFTLYRELNKAYKETVLRLSSAAEYKDKETKNHILRTGLYAKIIGKEFNFDEEIVEKLFLAAQMHDIGKIGIPDAILLKPGKLTEKEREIMEKHTLIGYNILKNSKSELLQMAAVIALEHHEKFNGKGYPFGKKGEEISIYGRIATVVDVFDALISDRPYKKGWSLAKTIDFLKNNAGSHFDPRTVEIVVKNSEKLYRVKKDFPD